MAELNVGAERVMAELNVGAERVMAAEPKKQKKEQMAEEACLCLVTEKECLVIKLSNIKKQEDDDSKDWNCLPSLDLDYVLPLPEPELCPFEFDSKIYMGLSGQILTCPGVKSRCMKDLRPFPIYEFKFEEQEQVIVPAESLDPVPLPFHSSFIANTPGSGDVFFHIYQRPRVRDSPLFYVLSSGDRVWKPLIPPSDFINLHMPLSMFVLHNNLFVSSFHGDPYLARFDTIEQSWTVEPAASNNLSNFIHDWFIDNDDDDHCREIYFPLISVTIPGMGSSNYTVCLMHEELGVPPKNPVLNVFAILVNHHNGRAALYQRLCKCFEGIQPAMYDGHRFNLVDLGNGKMCATLCGRQLGSTSLTLCISVFTLSVIKDFAALHLDSGDPPVERDFLQAEVHTKGVYNIKDCVRHAFVWPPTKGGRFQHITI